ncbi:fibro-slime domain-containing protein [Conexibacter stalactiti]|uniref:Fibro-slime domain-containing protein n=1 Tax=Conexibacter stalactiti TaxID=1940611 RepID=A0ABU4HZ11_9ACTN|nr:fibro-slime domain-containing protein [Conexibacter stalactiti]MDW5597937.1 fibro-slime domain-containing protein [Conexibacter stalactiti]MEC5038579.1 fibro-slime domain-containing protein [Conexibacter stalactiti]
MDRRRFVPGALLVVAALALPSVASAADPPATVTLDGTMRDFRGSDLSDLADARRHIDFENANGLEMGIVQATLGTDGLPAYAKGNGAGSPTTHGRDAFDQWFRDTPLVNIAEPLSLTLIRQPNGSYQHNDQTFFPFDDGGWVRAGREPARSGGHNFSFTVELHSELRYDGGETITITGDDDIWLFVNGRLAIDLGGVHGPTSGMVDLDQRAAQLGLTRGRAYDLDLFVAERHTTQSTLNVIVPQLGFDAGTATLPATATVGDTVTCAAAGWHPDLTLDYIWLRDGVTIAGADGADHATTAADADRTLTCEITGSRRTSATAVSGGLAVAARPEPRPEPRPDPDPDPIPDPPLPPAPLPPAPPAPLPAPANVTITERPSVLTRAREVRVGFAVDADAAGYECSLDGGAWTPCSSPHTLRELRAGDHRIEIRAVTTDGRRGAAAAHAFQVNPYPPGLTLAGGRTLRAAHDARVALRVSCSPREGEGRGHCRGSVQLRGAGKRTLARATFTARAGATATVSARLTQTSRRALTAAPGGALNVRVVVSARDDAGNSGRLSAVRTLSLR